MKKKAVFLDRDGVINDNKKPVNKPKDFIFFPWTFDAIEMLNKAGYLIYVVTNQGGIEMGYFTEDDLKAIHDEMKKKLEELRKQNELLEQKMELAGMVYQFELEKAQEQNRKGKKTSAKKKKKRTGRS